MHYLEENENEKHLESISSKEEEFLKEIAAKVESIEQRVIKLESEFDKVDHEVKAQKEDSKVDVQKWKNGVEEYINTLHYEIDEQNKLNKLFKQDVYDKLKVQRKATSDLNSRITIIFSNLQKLRPVASRDGRSDTSKLNTIL